MAGCFVKEFGDFPPKKIYFEFNVKKKGKEKKKNLDTICDSSQAGCYLTPQRFHVVLLTFTLSLRSSGKNWDSSLNLIIDIVIIRKYFLKEKKKKKKT